ncbi:MAG: cob(I)yrinic acid a,c-diamide adenosyltransferase [Saprospiraceae bacterium]|nr:cob(I)yrinic acid a,c-diamide adenosyltransferase [Saprospiraceae bacterium]MCF8248464.1 cob(I)yrinic acid a,c-diamide adenosyltransferase [Saprospiraceae bacterium]MCF8310198.1 cob(I)yrinic acid a,c-diamide adenosyltransferase [Saprospiraceae bacterium]MCF8439363.1 cob(I)yrinic acid a,c-diamide adenosyltransferase [Saprospiraceae bacterium]
MAFKIYTKTGDEGQTALFGGKRLPKSHLRIECYGTVDELNSFIGLVRDCTEDEHVRAVLFEIQNRLFDLGATLATDPSKNLLTPTITQEDIQLLENEIDGMEATLPSLKNFILPGGHQTVSHCHVARCVCRRAERLVVALNMEESVSPDVLKYLNRLSDFLFVLARKLGQNLGANEVVWKGK